MKNYDGWTFKVDWEKPFKPFLLIDYFHRFRSDVIKDFERHNFVKWRKFKKGRLKNASRGIYKLVKVKLIEVD